ncbi:hypothetical protein CENSYa_1677 [Cenarchaeum symbiosum A]|uniref:Uncharacterized protein n=1 Tax=Cenarchaeum symbiosum (strain A) TaxID=414004 RepID=A0RY77_CENSY|nr:hypothetical protein CENSYa_1677 [Cenarchaeum symbiosum A]
MNDNAGWKGECWDVLESISFDFFHRRDKVRLLYLMFPVFGYALIAIEALVNRLGWPLSPSIIPMLYFHSAAMPLIGHYAASVIAVTCIHVPIWLAVAHVTVRLARRRQRARAGAAGAQPRTGL